MKMYLYVYYVFGTVKYVHFVVNNHYESIHPLSISIIGKSLLTQYFYNGNINSLFDILLDENSNLIKQLLQLNCPFSHFPVLYQSKFLSEVFV